VIFDEFEIGQLILKFAKQAPGFFIRQKSNYEWEAGWGAAAGPDTERAGSPLAALRALKKKPPPDFLESFFEGGLPPEGGAVILWYDDKDQVRIAAMALADLYETKSDNK